MSLFKRKKKKTVGKLRLQTQRKGGGGGGGVRKIDCQPTKLEKALQISHQRVTGRKIGEGSEGGSNLKTGPTKNSPEQKEAKEVKPVFHLTGCTLKRRGPGNDV